MPTDLVTLRGLNHRQLQALAKEYGVPANQKKGDIIKQLAKASAESAHWQLCSQVRVRLAHIQGFSAFLELCPLGDNKRKRAAEAEQLWKTLKLGVPLCFLFNQLPRLLKIDESEDPEEVDLKDIKAHKAATTSFIEGLAELKEEGQWDGPDPFALSDLYKKNPGSDVILKVVRVVLHLVDKLLQEETANRHVQDLPIEVLATVFNYLAQATAQGPSDQHVNVILVCRRWHDVALETPALWACICVQGPLEPWNRKPTKDLLKLQTLVQRSKAKPLSLILRYNNAMRFAYTGINEYLKESLHRITSVDIFIDFTQYHAAWPIHQAQACKNMPNIKRLNLIQDEDDSSPTSFHHLTSTALRHLRTFYTRVDWSTSQFPNLQTLEITEPRNWVDFHVFQAFLAALGMMRKLESLEMTFREALYDTSAVQEDLAAVPKCTVPKLRWVKLAGLPSYRVRAWLTLVETPELQELQLLGRWKGGKKKPVEDWTGCSPVFPELKTLTIWFWCSPEKLVQLVAPPITTLKFDIVVIGDTETAAFQQQFLPLSSATVCKLTGNSASCRHEECKALPQVHDFASKTTKGVRLRVEVDPSHFATAFPADVERSGDPLG